jgi:hypothetical protein
MQGTNYLIYNTATMCEIVEEYINKHVYYNDDPVSVIDIQETDSADPGSFEITVEPAPPEKEQEND